MIFTYDYVKNFIEANGHKLVSNSYTNNHTKLLIVCPNGHEYNVTLGNFKQGKRCPICFGNKKLTYEYVKSFIESTGYTVLSDTYINNRTKLMVRCDKGHEYGVTFNNFKIGQRCSACAGNKKLVYDYIKKYIEDTGYTLISDDYKEANSKLYVRCPKGHEYTPTFGNFYRGQRCPTCAGKSKEKWSTIVELFNRENYKLLSKETDYRRLESELKFICPNGHINHIRWGNFKNGSRCCMCAYESKASKGEIEVRNFIESLNVSVLYNDRTQIINPLTGYNLELDMWIPSMRKAIEYNGTYWHSLSEKQVNDRVKKEQCVLNKIDLLVVKEYNWNINREFEKTIITEFIKGVHPSTN